MFCGDLDELDISEHWTHNSKNSCVLENNYLTKHRNCINNGQMKVTETVLAQTKCVLCMFYNMLFLLCREF